LANEAMPNDSQVIFLLYSVRFSKPKKSKKHEPQHPKHHH